MALPNVEQFQSALSGAKVLVVGDLILDHYIKGTTDRVSPEAPVPVVLCQSEENLPGGAANVARNVRDAGCGAVLAGVVGDDANGKMLVSQLKALKIDTKGITSDPGRPTTTKTRVVAQGQQMIRVDRENSAAVGPQTLKALLQASIGALAGCGAAVVSDYGKGCLPPEFLADFMAAARQKGVPVFVDPKGRDYARYRGCFALTPNAREAQEATGFPTNTPDGLKKAAQAIQTLTDCDCVVITRGAGGLALFPKGQDGQFVAATAREVFDVTGAGDTFVAHLAMGVATGLGLQPSAELANAAAGIVVAKSGVATVAPSELIAVARGDSSARKICSVTGLASVVERLRAANKKIVFTNGCFDFIHAGHVSFLQSARALGDVLILATNTDEVIARLKGAPRPIIKQNQRLRLLAAMEAVDHIVLFSDDTPHNLLETIKPDVLVKGSNYTYEQVEGHEIVEAYGGKVVRLELLENISTDNLIGQMKS